MQYEKHIAATDHHEKHTAANRLLGENKERKNIAANRLLGAT